jgi:hypothetical protein
VKSTSVEQPLVAVARDDGSRQRCQFNVLPMAKADARCHSDFVFSCASPSEGEAIASAMATPNICCVATFSALSSQSHQHHFIGLRRRRHFHAGRHSSAKVV